MNKCIETPVECPIDFWAETLKAAKIQRIHIHSLLAGDKLSPEERRKLETMLQTLMKL